MIYQSARKTSARSNEQRPTGTVYNLALIRELFEEESGFFYGYLVTMHNNTCMHGGKCSSYEKCVCHVCERSPKITLLMLSLSAADGKQMKYSSVFSSVSTFCIGLRLFVKYEHLLVMFIKNI